MMGFGVEESALGIIPRAIDAVFHEKDVLSAQGNELRIWVSAVELYSERLTDLLQPEKTQGPELRIVDIPNLGVCVPGLLLEPCPTVADIRKKISYVHQRRAVTATNINATSSRSHMVFTLKIK